MIKNDLIEAIHLQVGGFSCREIGGFVSFLIREMSDTLAAGESVKITNFGVFDTRQKNARIGRNPKTLVEAEISARRVARFRMSENLSQSLNVKNADDADISCISDQKTRN
jgi:integration host factor subunit alpha